MSRLSGIFARSGKCFIPFVTAGYPDLESTREVVLELARSGAHIVELGIPFSDPIADGPVIQRSSFAALEHGYTMADHISLVREVRDHSEVGLIFMTYANPVFKYGLGRLELEANSAGLDGILISDLTPEEYGHMTPLAELDTIFLAAPTSTDERLEKIARVCRGFVYLVARTGVTGKQTRIDRSLGVTLDRIRKYSTLPVAVGFGIACAGDVRRVWSVADGAVVGTAIVRFMQEHERDENLPALVGRFVRERLLP